MPKLDIQPEDVERLIGADFEPAEEGFWWDTRHWHSDANLTDKQEFLSEVNTLIGDKVTPQEIRYLISTDVDAITFFNYIADKIAETGLYVYNSDNFFEVYDADEVEGKYDQEALLDMLEETSPPQALRLH